MYSDDLDYNLNSAKEVKVV